MARYGISQSAIAELLKMTPENIRAKIAGRVKFSYEETLAIKDEFFPERPLEYLFATEEEE